jgi:hypothetical protein
VRRAGLGDDTFQPAVITRLQKQRIEIRHSLSLLKKMLAGFEINAVALFITGLKVSVLASPMEFLVCTSGLRYGFASASTVSCSIA